ncbi:MAG: LCP family protein [Bacillota bacterium]|uniref:Polyisoprenyl-teichoic acid--peptidoglycan teichoic acid transferase TagU n=1 Tax=Virgibacillus salarius TaxID=447199 RepID=A0A941IAU6_9BACI|nr:MULTISPECIES: LCP family protein [Bacillaceae]NAZ09737.1 transcriptional regulator LytR [Agaribacter marinus]MBR7797028.1 LCP family protein [Virgibacillus salarius]MCC2250772.1 LCP family protein [Virgibacillus sp. AGTR]MDY7042852.1 LCP family protein [Virgibacillus sp. M23]QRZ18056.1 LCP family protein [Virgibacillus sp. AGTR]
MNSRVEKKKHKKRKWLFWVGGIILALILVVGVFSIYVWNKLGDTVETMHNPLNRDNDPDRKKELESIFKDTKSVNILLLGVDERDGDKGRSDTMILLSLNPKTNSMKMLSIPRDTYVTIPGKGKDKINHAYAFGDVELSVQTVEENFDLPVHYYARVNMEGFEQGVDAIGGVTITNDTAFSQGGIQFPAGEIQLNGKEALSYIRMRKNDPRGDLGRNERQRAVIMAAINKGASFSSITKVGEILNILGDNVKTNLNMDAMQTLFSDYRGTRKNISSMEISGNGQRINNTWYYVVPDSEFNRITTEIKAHMNEK